MLRSLDLALLRLLRTRLHPPALERAAAVVSRVGEHGLGWQVGSAAGAVLDADRRAVYLRAMRAAGAAYAANQLVKLVVRRRRPVLVGLPPLATTLSERSYPSAHAATSFAAADALSAALPWPPVYAAAVAVALTRPYLGVHWPSDSLAGAALGRAVARLVP
ncbi:MAG: phosphatase PAP2 family protein [Thermoleophilaceae bacterium]